MSREAYYQAQAEAQWAAAKQAWSEGVLVNPSRMDLVRLIRKSKDPDANLRGFLLKDGTHYWWNADLGAHGTVSHWIDHEDLKGGNMRSCCVELQIAEDGELSIYAVDQVGFDFLISQPFMKDGLAENGAVLET